jgi:hypothetical protein
MVLVAILMFQPKSMIQEQQIYNYWSTVKKHCIHSFFSECLWQWSHITDFLILDLIHHLLRDF